MQGSDAYPELFVAPRTATVQGSSGSGPRFARDSVGDIRIS